MTLNIWKRCFAATLVVLAVVGACVTINIYFPAEKVESVAGEIVQDIRGRDGAEKPPAAKPQGAVMKKMVLAFASSTAWAQDAAVTVSNPTIRALKDKMKSRWEQMKPFYRQGMLKEGNDGYVAVAGTGGLGLKEQRDLKGLAEAENKDRGQLYGEVAKALNIDSSQVGRVAEIFAKEWQKTLM